MAPMAGSQGGSPDWRNPLAMTEFLILEFDPHKGRLTVFRDLAYSAKNRDDVLRDAEAAAAAAQAEGEPLKYCVIRVATEAVFSS
jgi:hypothetical protein